MTLPLVERDISVYNKLSKKLEGFAGDYLLTQLMANRAYRVSPEARRDVLAKALSKAKKDAESQASAYAKMRGYQLGELYAVVDNNSEIVPRSSGLRDLKMEPSAPAFYDGLLDGGYDFKFQFRAS